MKKIFAIMLVMVMCISMVACANTNKEVENTEPDTTVEQVKDETAETIEGTENTETTEPSESTEETTPSEDAEDVVTPDGNKNEENKDDSNNGNVNNDNTNKEDNKENNKTEEDKSDDIEDGEDKVVEPEETKPTDDVAGATEDKNNNESTEDVETTEPVEEEKEEVATPTYTPNQLEQNIFNIINQHRVNAGLPALTFEYSFYSAAKTRATEAATCFSHTRPNGSNYTSVFSEKGIKWDFIAGENVGRYFADAETAMNAFMNSQVHKDNILYNGYTRVCIAVVESDIYPGYYVIEQLFAGPAGAY